MTPNRSLWAAIVFLALAQNGHALQVAPSAKQIDACFDALATTAFGTIYADDGAGDGTITESGERVDPSGPVVRPLPAVKGIVDWRGAAIPALIDHLDDTRPTAVVFEGKPVPLGHLALDILTHIVKSTDHVFVTDCADDGLGACIRRGFYFRPNAPAQEIAAVKARWLTALKRGWLRFEYPSWWPKQRR